jgi:transposase
MTRLGFYMHAYVLDKEKGNNTMYTLQNAATVLGVSKSTVRKWIAESNIEKTVIETDRKRIYLSYNDILALADKYRPLKVNIDGQEKSYQDTTGMYSIEDVARLLGASYETARKWIAKANIEKKIIITDQRRAYISYSDIVALAEKHNLTIGYDKVMKGQESDVQADDHPEEKKLYSLPEAAMFLGVTEFTVKQWLTLYNIEKKTLEADRRRIYITYSDIMLLASKQKRASGYPVDITTNIREIRSRLEKIEDGILNLEKYIKRSVYLGK